MDVGLIFLSWFIAIAIGLGLALMSVYRAQANGKDDSDGDYTSGRIVDMYDNLNFGNKVSYLLVLGSMALSVIFFPFMHKKKDEE